MPLTTTPESPSARLRNYGTCRWILLILTIVVLVGYAGCRRMLVGLGSWLDVGEDPVASTFVLTLPGDETTRPFVAAALLKVGLAEKALLLKAAETPLVQDGLRPSTDRIIAEVLRRRGVSEERLVWLGTVSHTTYDDARVLREFLKEQPPHTTVTIVTNDYHTRRARWIFCRVFSRDSHRLFFVSAPVDGVHKNNWWQRKSGCQLYVSEYVKLAAYWLLYGGLSRWLVMAGVVFVLGAIYRMRRGRCAGSEQVHVLSQAVPSGHA